MTSQEFEKQLTPAAKANLKIQAVYIAESMKAGIPFEEAVEKSFHQLHDFLEKVSKSSQAKKMIAEAVYQKCRNK